MNKLVKKEKGFTIIEVVLVLAIAGLIFMVVFLAVPALQRSQQDTQMKNDVGRLSAGITQFKSNNKGVLPEIADVQGEVVNSLKTGGSSFTSPLTNGDYDIVVADGGAAAKGEMKVQLGNAGCDGGLTISTGTASHAISILLADGTNSYCQTN